MDLFNSTFQPSTRRGAETGRQNFRSKRFSRNVEKREPPAHFKAQVRATRTEYSDVGEEAAAAAEATVRVTFSATMQTRVNGARSKLRSLLRNLPTGDSKMGATLPERRTWTAAVPRRPSPPTKAASAPNRRGNATRAWRTSISNKPRALNWRDF